MKNYVSLLLRPLEMQNLVIFIKGLQTVNNVFTIIEIVVILTLRKVSSFLCRSNFSEFYSLESVELRR